MMLLQFAATNHKSLRDRVELDLRKPSLQTLRPRGAEAWADHVYPVAGIFGANASGKSSVIDALHYTFVAIASSATRWQDRRRTPRAPFLLDDKSREMNSSYELDFVLDDTRYQYGFEVGARGIEREWLRDLPSLRWRTLLLRESDGVVKLRPSLRSLGSVTRRELALSRAMLLEHPELSKIGGGLIEGFEITKHDERTRERRLVAITESLVSGSITFDDIVSLLRVADIGVEGVDIREEAMPSDAVELMVQIKRLIDERNSNGERGSGDDGAENTRIEFQVEDSDAVLRNLEFIHRGKCENPPRFSIADESDGTIAWLALTVPVVEVLRDGGIFVADELDSSLHSYLVEALIEFFSDASVNRRGAQLIFTSHDTYLLSPLSDLRLEPEQVWFTAKGNDGATELFSLADFPRHKDANIAKRYLSGRYGAVPRMAPSAILRLLEGAKEPRRNLEVSSGA